MASLVDFFAPPDYIPAFYLGDLALSEADLREEAGLTQSRLLRRFGEEDLPNLVSRFAARGAFYSGPAQRSADLLRLGVTEQIGDIQRRLSRALADLERRRLFANLGVRI